MRNDLLALTADALAALTNRGLVKRAMKELDAAAPVLRVDADGTLHGDFPDGPAAALPTGGLQAGRCGCGAAGACRHLIGLVLAYHRANAPSVSAEPVAAAPPADVAAPAPVALAEATVPKGSASAPVALAEAAATKGRESAGVTADAGTATGQWSPGQVTDDELGVRIGARLLSAARRAHRAGYPARVRRATAHDPVPQVDLPAATVRFLVPGDLGFVHTDAAAGSRDDVIALAVWAFRAADAAHPDAADVRLDVGGQVVAATGSSLDRALAVAAAVLQDGAVHLGPGLDATIADVRRGLDDAGLRWPLLALDDVAEQLTSYRDRSVAYRPELLAGHLAELHARHRAAGRPGAVLRSSVLGTAEAAETPLRRARLDSLGCRVRAAGDRRVAEVYLAHADSGTVLVLRRDFDGDEDGPALARRRVDRSTLGALAAGNLVTESAVRSASRAVRLATARVAKTTVSPSRGNWGELPASLVADDFAVLGRELDDLAPRPVRARVEAELVRVLAVATVRAVAYAPGDQRLQAELVDRSGNTATVVATHAAAAPGRLDALAEALAGERGPVRHLSGVVRRSAGVVVVEPIGVAAGEQVIVPDLASPQPVTGLALAADAVSTPLTAALTTAHGLLAEVAHRGLQHLPSGYRARLDEAARRLAGLGVRRLAEAVTGFGATLDTAPDDTAEQAWVDAYLRVELALDLC